MCSQRLVPQVHLEYSNTRLETPATDGRGENSVRAAKVMVQRQESQSMRWASRTFVKHPGLCSDRATQRVDPESPGSQRFHG